MNWIWEVENLISSEVVLLDKVFDWNPKNTFEDPENPIRIRLSELPSIEVFNPFPHYWMWIVNFTTSTPFVKLYDSNGSLILIGQVLWLINFELKYKRLDQ